MKWKCMDENNSKENIFEINILVSYPMPQSISLKFKWCAKYIEFSESHLESPKTLTFIDTN